MDTWENSNQEEPQMSDPERSSEVVYRSNVRIERIKGPIRHAWLPGESEPVTFGLHGAVAEHYGIRPGKFPEHATTLDYVVAAAAG